MDETKKTCDIFELTVPFETRITKANELKMEKYTHFLTDINPNYSTTVTPFEIGSRGLITTENKNRLRKIYMFTDRSIKLNTFIKNISSIAVMTSYYIFVTRKEPSWTYPAYLKPTHIHNIQHTAQHVH